MEIKALIMPLALLLIAALMIITHTTGYGYAILLAIIVYFVSLWFAE